MVHNIPLSSLEENLPKVVTDLPKVVTDLPKVVTDLPKVVTDLPKVVTDLQNISHENSMIPSVDTNTFKCDSCYRVFSNKYTLLRHTPKCNHKQHPYQCPECSKVFSGYSSLYHHKKHCKALIPTSDETKPPVVQTASSITNNNIQNQNVQHQSVQNAEQIQNNTIHNTYNIVLPCPQTKEEAFDFDCENITYQILKQIVSNTNNSSTRFNRFVDKVFENPKNRVIRKTNPKDSHSMIHTGNGTWKYAYDKDTLPILTHHMTTAALGKIIEMESKASYLIESIKSFRLQVREINEMEEHDEAYKDTLQRMKIAVVNFTQALMKEEKLLQEEMEKQNQLTGT